MFPVELEESLSSALGEATRRPEAWYELVPSAAHTIHMIIDPGDRVSASVRVRGAHVTVTLSDLTRDTRFARTIADRMLDVGSAEWSAEAPSDCSASDCTILPLADFGNAHFLSAGATTSSGVTRSLTRAPWTRTRISLGSSFAAHASDGGDEDTTVTALPSAPTDPLGAFEVTDSATSETTGTTQPSGPPSTGPSGPGSPPSCAARSRTLRRGA
jgi:hypothetical protein